MPSRTLADNDYRFGFNGKEADRNGEWGSSTHYDYGFRIYNPEIARFLSVDPLIREFPFSSPYSYSLNNPIRFIDPDGRAITSYPVKPLDSFLKVLKEWDIEASKLEYRKEIHSSAPFNPGMSVRSYENENEAKFRIMANDITANKQIINTVGGYKKAFGAFIDVGLPLDFKHFMNYAALSNKYPDPFVKAFSVHREYRQSLDIRNSGFSSSFVANDIFSNYLGVYFGDDVGSNNDFTETLSTFLKETKELFTTGNVKDAKHLTPLRVAQLKRVAKKYYDTDDLTKFQNTGDFYKKEGENGYDSANINAQKRTGLLCELELKLEWTLFPGPEPGYREETKAKKRNND